MVFDSNLEHSLIIAITLKSGKWEVEQIILVIFRPKAERVFDPFRIQMKLNLGPLTLDREVILSVLSSLQVHLLYIFISLLLTIDGVYRRSKYRAGQASTSDPLKLLMHDLFFYNLSTMPLKPFGKTSCRLPAS